MASEVKPVRWDDLDEAAITDLLGIGLFGRQALPLGATAPMTTAAMSSAYRVTNGFRRFFSRARRDQAHRLLARLRTQFPAEDEALLKQITREELDREAEFQRRMLIRVGRDLKIAFAIKDPQQRNARVRSIIDRERTYIIAREQAMAERAMGAVEVETLKRTSPEGAYWMLSPRVKKSTLDCVALAGQVWPHEVLKSLHPPLHHNCACSLVPFRDAVTQGLVHPDQIPEPKDAVRRARDLYNRAKALEHAADAEEVEHYLQEAYDLRYPKGTAKGGEYRPRRGGDPGIRRSIHHALRDLVPGHHLLSPAARRDTGVGDWKHVAGHRVFVPEHRAFERVFGGHTYTSPPGSGFLYRDGSLYKGEHGQPYHSLALPGGRLDTGTVERIESYLDALRTAPPTADSPDGTYTGRERLLDHTWHSWDQFKDETNGLAIALGKAFGAKYQTGTITSNPKMYDHSGLTDWQGNTTFGRRVEPTVNAEAKRLDQANPTRSFDDLDDLVNTYRVQAHETGHKVNPMDEGDYETFGGPLEEGMTEDIAHILLAVDMQRHGRQDLLDWVKANPTAPSVAGTYKGYRQAISKLFDRMKVPERDRAAVEMHLKFQVPPTEWEGELAALSARYDPHHPLSTNDVHSWFLKATIDRPPRGVPGEHTSFFSRLFGQPDVGVTGTAQPDTGTHTSTFEPPLYIEHRKALGLIEHGKLTPYYRSVFSQPEWHYTEDGQAKTISSETIDDLHARGLVSFRKRADGKITKVVAHGRVDTGTALLDKHDPGLAGEQDPGAFSRRAVEDWMAAAPPGAWTGILFHGTDSDATVHSIQDEGFKPQGWAGGTWLARTREQATQFAARVYQGPGKPEGRGPVIEVGVRADKPYLKSEHPDFDGSIYNMNPYEGLREQGYDAVVDDVNPNGYILLLNPQAARVVQSGEADPGTIEHTAAKLPEGDQIVHAYEGFKHGGLHTEIDLNDTQSINDNAPKSVFSVSGWILDGKKAVGNFERSFKVEDGKLVVTHDRMNLDSGYENHGFATAFNKHAEEKYREMGVDHIEIETDRVGGYAWARAGYEFAGDPVETAKLLLKSRQRMRWYANMPRSIKPGTAKALADDIKAGKLTSPAQIAAWGRDETWLAPRDYAISDGGPVGLIHIPEGTKMWPGKLFMLNTNWTGVKQLGPSKRESYGMVHSPPATPDEGGPSWDIEQTAPDFYAHPEYYRTGDDVADRESTKALYAIRDKPNDLVSIYRSSPIGELNQGDWVSFSRTYARMSGLHPTDPAKDAPVFRYRVHARDVRWPGDSINEFGYVGGGVPEPTEELGEMRVLAEALDAQAVADAFDTFDVRVPPDEIWGDEDEQFWNSLDGLAEAYAETLHPRDRHGRWTRKVYRGIAVGKKEGSYEAQAKAALDEIAAHAGGVGWHWSASQRAAEGFGYVVPSHPVVGHRTEIVEPPTKDEVARNPLLAFGTARRTGKPQEVSKPIYGSPVRKWTGVVVEAEVSRDAEMSGDEARRHDSGFAPGLFTESEVPLKPGTTVHVKAVHVLGEDDKWHRVVVDRELPVDAKLNEAFEGHTGSFGPPSYDEHRHPRGRGGKWIDSGVSDVKQTAKAVAPETKEVVEPKDWTAPPPPVGKQGESVGGRGYSSDKAYGTNTALGRVGEQAFTSIVGGRILHPEGHGEQSPLDVHYDGYGFEVKAVSRKTLGYKATPKPYEIDQKEAFAKELGVKGALAIVVVDSDNGTAHVYYRDGLKGGRLSQNTGWQFLGSGPLPKVEEAYVEGLHPRDRLGRWTDGPHTVTPTGKPDGIALPHFDDDVMKITTPQSAEGFFKGLGIRASLTPHGEFTPPPDYYRSLAQATKDAVARFPSLRNGERKLGEVRFTTPTDPEGARGQDTWATTGPEGASEAWVEMKGLKPDGGTKWGWADGNVSIKINQDNSDFGGFVGLPGENNPGGALAYGLMMHELGHAVDTTSGLEFSRGYGLNYGHAEADLLKVNGLSPTVIDRFSHYGASQAFEGWAETFATLNTPGALAMLPADLQTTLREAQGKINAQWPTRLI